MDLIKEFLLEAFPNPDRDGCPDEETIMALAADRLPIDHPACLHVGSCSECFAEYCGCCLELAGKVIDAKESSVAKDRGLPSLSWSDVASSLGDQDAAATALQSLRERIAAYRHRFSR
jgi:hypothetical protein